MLEDHGYTIEVKGDTYVVMFPEGTKRKEIYPRTQCEKHRIILPDGFQLMNEYDPMRDINLLFLVNI